MQTHSNSPSSEAEDTLGLYRLSQLLKDSNPNLLASVVQQLDAKRSEFVLSLALIRKTNKKLKIHSIFIDGTSLPVYIYRKIGANIDLLNTCFLLLGPLDLTQPAFKDQSVTLAEYFETHGYPYPDINLIETSNTLKVLFDRSDLQLSYNTKTQELDPREKYGLLAIRVFSHRSLDQVLNCLGFPSLLTVSIFRMIIQAIKSFNGTAFQRLLATGIPRIPLFDELIKIQKWDDTVKKDVQVIPAMDIIELPNKKILDFWQLVQISEGETSYKDLLKAQRSNLRRLGLWLTSNVNPYSFPYTDVTTLKKILSQSAGIHGVPESTINNLSIEIQQELIKYLGLNIDLKEFTDHNLIFITTVIPIIICDAAYATNFFHAIGVLTKAVKKS